ncbi:hypothetical protein [Marinicella sp. W31]|uniref:hypothetical protein n=1 Tax=Marinicella sp. W31 TaxID=3023713 RepID=UPI0037563425
MHSFYKDAAADWQWIPLIPITGMVACILYIHKQQDEFVRRVLHLAYVIAFWLILLVLLLMSFLPSVEQVFSQVVPLWVLPLMAWLGGYLYSWFHHK